MTINLITKRLVEKFRALAYDQDAIKAHADSVRAANPSNTIMGDICNRFKEAKTALAVLNLADELLPPDGSTPHTMMQEPRGASTSPNPVPTTPAQKSEAERVESQPPLLPRSPATRDDPPYSGRNF